MRKTMVLGKNSDATKRLRVLDEQATAGLKAGPIRTVLRQPPIGLVQVATARLVYYRSTCWLATRLASKALWRCRTAKMMG
jgi:hypothetical protein